MRFRENGLWLMCKKNFKPNDWGGIGFPYETPQDRIAQAGTIVAIWIHKTEGPSAKQGKVVGFVELSGNTNDISKFISWDALLKHIRKPVNKDKNRWPFAVEIKRAWEVDSDCWRIVDEVFVGNYRLADAKHIGANAKMIREQNNFHRMSDLSIQAVKVYQQEDLPLEPHATAGHLLESRGILEDNQ